MQAIKYNSHECLKLLLDRHPEWNRATTNWRDNTLLHVAAQFGDEKTLSILAEQDLHGLVAENKNTADKTAADLFADWTDPSKELVEAFSRVMEKVNSQEAKNTIVFDLEKGVARFDIEQNPESMM